MAQRVFPDTPRVQTTQDVSGDVFRVVMVKTDPKTQKQTEVASSKPLVIKAAHAWEAIEKYKYASGIIATDNSFSSEAVAEDDPRYADALDLPVRPYQAPVLTGFVERTGREPEVNLGVNGV